MRASSRRRWLSTVVVVFVVAIAAGAVLTLVAGARRTASAPDAFTAAVGGDADASLQQFSGPPRTGQIAALPGVKSVQAMTFAFAAFPDSSAPPGASTLAFIGTKPASSLLVAGRETEPANPHEFIADQSFVAANHAHLGQHFRAVTWSRKQGSTGQGFNAAPAGPSFDATLVGVIRSAAKLDAGYSIAVFSPGLLPADIGTVATITAVRLEPGVTRNQLRSELDRLPGGGALSVDDGLAVSSQIRNAVDAQAEATWIMAIVAGVAALIALGQLLTRRARLADADRASLSAAGYSANQLMAETLIGALLPAASGVVLGAVIAVVASSRFPMGFVRPIEPKLGTRIDATALGLGGLALVVGLLAWVGVTVLTVGSRRDDRTRTTLSDAITKRAPSATAGIGARFALASRERTAAGTLVTLAVIVAGMVGSLGFAASLGRLVSERGRFGGNYDLEFGDSADLTASHLTKSLQGDPDITGLMILTGDEARAGRTTVGIVGFDSVQGGLAPRALSGRLPGGLDEIALGRVTARQLGLHAGDDIDLTRDAKHASYRVVGTVVVPTIAGNDGVGQGAVLTAAGFRRLATAAASNIAGVDLRAGAPANTPARLGKRVGAEAGTENTPSAILNVQRVRRIPTFLAALLAALLLTTLLHAVIVSVRNRRRDLAVLRALGADRRWIGRAVHWQTTVLTALPVVVGVPLGLVGGSVAFRAFVGRIGAIPDPSLPIALVVASAVALVVVANVVVIVPIRRARRLSNAQQLRVE